MRTTVDIDPEKLARIQEISGEKSKGRAINRAMETMIKEHAKAKLLAARGTFNLRSRSEWHEKDLELELEKIKERERRHGSR